MTWIYLPPLRPISKDATREDRQAAMAAYRNELIECNPNRFDPDGAVKTPTRVVLDAVSGFLNLKPKT